MTNRSSLLHYFLNILLIKFPVQREKTKTNSVNPAESHCADGAGEIQVRAPLPLWSKLDRDILDLIIEKLDLFSRVYFGAVCRSWKLAIEEARTPDPVLRLLPRNPYSNRLTFSDFHTGALHELDLPNSAKGKWSWCITSSDGRWIVVITSHHQLILNSIEISLFDPISRSLLRLPKINDARICQSITRSKKKRIRDRCLLGSKFEIFSVGSQNIIVWLFGGWYLVFCKSGGKKWYRFRISYEGCYADICFINGALYVLSSERNLFCNEFDSSSVASIQTLSMKFEGVEITVKVVPTASPERRCFSICNLVNFNGELLRVQKLFVEAAAERSAFDEDGVRYLHWRRPSGFLLSKIEHQGNRMICSKLNGGGLGGEALLLSQRNCICIPGKKFEGVEEKCVYFLNKCSGQWFISCSYDEIGVCHMDNGRIESALPCFPQADEDGHGLDCWFLPRIKKKGAPDN